MIIIEISSTQFTYSNIENKWYGSERDLLELLNDYCILDFEEYGPSLSYRTNGIDGEVLKLAKKLFGVNFKLIKIVSDVPVEQVGIVV